MNRFIVMTASAHVPSSWKWKGTYRRVAVVETDLPAPQEPAMISDRARGVVRIVQTWERLWVGTTDRDAFSKAKREAGDIAFHCNAKAVEAAKVEARNAKQRARRQQRRINAEAQRILAGAGFCIQPWGSEPERNEHDA